MPNNLEMINTPMWLNLFIVGYMALSVQYFTLSRKSVETLRNIGRELTRHTLKYHNGGANESSHSLWLAINDFWVEDMVSNTDEFLPQMMGFQDFELNHSTGTLTAKTEKSVAAKRLIVLSLIPLLLTCIIPVLICDWQQNPATGRKTRNAMLGAVVLGSSFRRPSSAVAMPPAIPPSWNGKLIVFIRVAWDALSLSTGHSARAAQYIIIFSVSFTIERVPFHFFDSRFAAIYRYVLC